MALFSKGLTASVSTFRFFGRTLSRIRADEELRDAANQIAEAQRRALDTSGNADYRAPIVYETGSYQEHKP